MNRPVNGKQPPAYPLTQAAYEVVLTYWQEQIAAGRVELGKVQAMNELILDGAASHGMSLIPSPTNGHNKKRTTPKQAAARASN